MKKFENLIVFLTLIFIGCFVPVVKVAVAAEPLKEIAKLGLFFIIPAAYIVFFITVAVQTAVYCISGKSRCVS